MSLLQFIETAKANAAYKILKNDADSGSPCHAYVFSGSDRLLLSLLASLFAADILGKTDAHQRELVFSEKHSDVIRLPYDELDGKKRVKAAVSDVEKLIGTLNYRPVYGEKKVYIINYAETLTPAGQNKLLKSLEEPPKSVIFILLTTVKAALLPTVLSRCKTVEPHPIALCDIKEALCSEYRDAEKSDLVAALCGGSLETAASMMVDKRFGAVFATAFSCLLKLAGSKNILFCSAQLLNYKDKLDTVLKYYEMLFRDIMVCGAQKPELVGLSAHLAEIERLAADYPPDACINILAKIAKANARLKNNGNAASIIDELLFSIAEIKANYKRK